MKKLLKNIKAFPAYLYAGMFLSFYLHTRLKHIRSIVEADAKRMCDEKEMEYKGTESILFLFLNKETCFRDVLYWRGKYKLRLLQYLFSRYSSLLFDGNMEAVGGAFFFHHPFSTVINAKYVGYGCTFRNNTTIGNKLNKAGELCSPVLLGNTDIGVNACVIGDVTIGKNCKIGAGSIVVKSFEGNSIIAGNPAKCIRKIENDSQNISSSDIGRTWGRPCMVDSERI